MALDPSEMDVAVLAFLAGSAAQNSVLLGMHTAGHAGLRQAHGYIFQHLIEGSPTVGELARALGVTQQAASKAASELEDLGYVQRRPEAADRRITRLVLTDRGRAAVETARDLRLELEAQVTARIGAGSIRATRRALAALLDVSGGLASVRTRAVRPPEE